MQLYDYNVKIERQIEITPTSVILDGQPITVQHTGEQMLVELYRRFCGNYPKFFKMDTLSRLGFIAAEILMKDPDRKPSAIIMANRSASIKNDTDYLATISHDNYYPSPSLFVYTLPNIVTGEIAIRHQIQGETSFYILDHPEQLEPIINSYFSSPLQGGTEGGALTGWCECSQPDTFYAKIQILWNN